MREIIEIYKALLKIMIGGVLGGAITIALIILMLSLKQCVTIKQTQNVQTTSNVKN